MIFLLLQKPKIPQHQNAQYDAVVPEDDKVMLLYIAHQEPDHQDADDKCYNAAHGQDQKFAAVKDKAHPQYLFEQFKQGSADHDGNRQVKGKFRRYASLQPDQQTADDGGTGTGGSGDQGQELEDADLYGFSVRNVHYAFYFSRTDVPGFDHDKQNTVNNQGYGYYFRRKEMFFHPVVEEDADDSGRQTGGDDLSPEVKGRPVQGEGTVFAFQRPDLFKVQQDDRQDRPQLDDHFKEFIKLGTDTQMDKFVQ